MQGNKCWVKGDNFFPTMAQDGVDLLHCRGGHWLLSAGLPALPQGAPPSRVQPVLIEFNLMALLVHSPDLPPPKQQLCPQLSASQSGSSYKRDVSTQWFIYHFKDVNL